MRHAAFRMDADTRDRWLRHMRAAVNDLHLDLDHEGQLWLYLERAVFSLAPA
jgi:hemoglobin